MSSLAALTLAVLAQLAGDLEGPVYSSPSKMRAATPTVQNAVGANVVFQESFVASVGRECEGAVPTPVAGSALTFTRATAASCTKGDGSIVTLGNNQPRLTSALGYLSEATATNQTLRSEEVDNASWTDAAVTAAAPVLNGANAGIAPDGTTTAEDYTFAATAAGEASTRTQAGACSGGAGRTASVYLRGVSAGGSTDLCVLTGVGTWSCSTCTFTTAWSRCSRVNVTAGSTNNIYVGNGTAYNGGTTRSQVRVYVWGAQCEVNGTHASSYMKTAGTNATRNADAMTTPTAAVVASLGCASVEMTPIGTAQISGLATWSDTSRLMYSNAGATQLRTYNGAVEPNIASSGTAGVTRLYRVTWNQAGNQFIIASPSETLSTTTTFNGWAGGTATLSIGFSHGAGTQTRGSLKNLVLGTTTTACP